MRQRANRESDHDPAAVEFNKQVLRSIAQVKDSLKELKKVVDSPREADKLIVEKVVLEGVPFGKTTLWSMVKDGKFPAPRRASPHRKAWVESEVQEWIKSRPVVEQYADENPQAA